MNKEKILSKLNIKESYSYIKSLNLQKTESPYWGGKSSIFSELINEKKTPKVIIELGAFLGDSTITMAKCLKKNNIDCVIITIDTWLGSQEHWLKDKCNLLSLYDNFEYGTSSLYNKFITNVLHEEVNNYIIPMPTTTDVAFNVLLYNNIKADIIYVDADHDETVVYNDLIKYSKLLNDDGILFGHDINWSGVHKAVNRYCEESGKNYVSILDDNTNKIKFWRIK
jgi:hypothetical protein